VSSTRSIVIWKRTDIDSLERMEIVHTPDGVTAASTVISVESGGFRLDHQWRLDRNWRPQTVTIERWDAQGRETLLLQRSKSGWLVNGQARPDLEGADEPDLSVTPFCNTFAIRRTPETVGATLTLDVAFIDGMTLSVARSRQHYIRHGPDRLRYVDLGLSSGFEADLVVDDAGLVLRYEHLFELIAQSA